MKYLLSCLSTIIIGYVFSVMFCSIGVNDAYRGGVNAVSLSVLFLSGVVSFWAYFIYDKLNK